jgi:geranylgeranyl diphosphate synthase type I
MRLIEFRPRFQPHLDAFIARKSRDYAAVARDEWLQQLLEYPAQLARGSGKRIRPFVAFSMFQALKQNEEIREDEILAALVGLEVFHLFCLVHDDVIDRGTQRYGLPTLNNFVENEMRTRGRYGEYSRIGDAQAMLVGDLLFSWSHDAMRESATFSEADAKALENSFRAMIDEVVVGQMIDVDMMSQRDTTRETIERKMLLKTASYTFVRPMQIGAALAGASTRIDEFCHEFGAALGLAFQMQDDLLDLIATPDTTQKTLFCDLRDGTHTLLTQYVLECGNSAQRDELRALLGADLGPQDRARVLALFEKSGALATIRDQISQRLREAETLLKNAPLGENERESFRDLIQILSHRDVINA